MKKFVHKVQEIGNKAAQIKAALESVPPKVAEVRQAVAATASQFQQLRNDVQSQVTALRADSEDKLIETLREIDCSVATFREAGYELFDVEMELGIPQRLIVDLEKVEDISHSRLRTIAAANEGNKTTHAILSALLKAEEMADRVDLANLTYRRLMVYVGPLPVVRLCWHSNAVEEHSVLSASAPAQAASSAPAASAFSTSSMFGSSSFFEQRSPARAPAAASENVPSSTAAAPSAPAPSAPPAPAGGHEDPLARFKKMPDLSKRH